MKIEDRNTFLGLVRLGIGTKKVSSPLQSKAAEPSVKFQDPIDWGAVKGLAEKLGLSAVVMDGIERLPEQQRPPKVFLLEWIGETLQGYEYRYDQYRKTIGEMAALYNAHGLKMMVLKGFACSLDWPKPEHRPCGDIDIWLFGKCKESDELIESLEFKDYSLKSVDSGEFLCSVDAQATSRKKVGRIKVDRSHHHHTVFRWQEFMVENHYDFVNVHAHRSSAEMEKVFKELGSFNVESGSLKVESLLKGCSVEGCKIPSVEVNGEKVYLPSANLHALFLIKHMVSHFAAAEISVRQVLDWAFFVEKHTKEIDWEWLDGIVGKFHMRDFVNCINAICVEDLGFDATIFRGVQFNPQLKERVLDDILEPAYGTAEPKGLIAKWVYKYRRWQGNGWKQDMCYSESRWESFWSLLRSHMMKP